MAMAIRYNLDFFHIPTRIMVRLVRLENPLVKETIVVLRVAAFLDIMDAYVERETGVAIDVWAGVTLLSVIFANINLKEDSIERKG